MVTQLSETGISIGRGLPEGQRGAQGPSHRAACSRPPTAQPPLLGAGLRAVRTGGDRGRRDPAAARSGWAEAPAEPQRPLTGRRGGAGRCPVPRTRLRPPAGAPRRGHPAGRAPADSGVGGSCARRHRLRSPALTPSPIRHRARLRPRAPSTLRPQAPPTWQSRKGASGPAPSARGPPTSGRGPGQQGAGAERWERAWPESGTRRSVLRALSC